MNSKTQSNSLPDPAKEFLGVGWNFPLALAADGSFSMAAYEEDVRQAILIILQTDPGERVMRPGFGAGLNAFVFEPMNTTTLAQLRRRIEESLIDFEPRIDVNDVQATPDRSQKGKLLIDIRYTVRLSNNVHNLVFPFYLEEGAKP